MARTRASLWKYLSTLHVTTAAFKSGDWRMQVWAWWNEFAMWCVAAMVVSGVWVWWRRRGTRGSVRRVTAVTASQLSERVRRRAAEAEERRLEIERLYELVQAMMLGGNPQRTIREFVQRVVQVFGCDAAAFYYLPGEEVIRSGPESNPVTDHDLQAAAEVDDLSVDAARTRATAPVRLGGHPLGSMALLGPLPSGQTLRAIVNLIAITIEKARAIEDASHVEAARQSEVLKSALLDSLAHDIKTPLTSIKAAVTSLWGARGADRELLTIINEEADRLNQLAAEVIAMARVEAGKFSRCIRA